MKITLYHGDNFKTTKLDPKLMNNGNNQEGIGIYFADKISFAEFYGKNVISIEADPKKFVNSRGYIEDELSMNKTEKLLIDLWKSDNEAMYYFLTDYIEVYEIDDIEEYHISELIESLGTSEVRNFQIEMVENFGVETFVKYWNKNFPNVHGTVQTDEGIYCVINTKYKIKQRKK
jgi:hypothetical protein